MAFQPVTHQQVFAALPPAALQEYQDTVSQINEVGKQAGLSLSTEKPDRTCPTTIIVVGILITLGAVFVNLAAHEVLPQGLNAISELGFPGQVIGVVALCVGILMTTGGLIPLIKMLNILDSQEFFEQEYHEAQIDLRNRYIDMTLNLGEATAVTDPENKQVTVYYRLSYVLPPGVNSVVSISYPYNTDPQEGIDRWIQEKEMDVPLVSFATLQGRAPNRRFR